MQLGLPESLIVEGEHPHGLLTVVAVGGGQDRLILGALEQELIGRQRVGHQVAAAQIVVPVAQRIGVDGPALDAISRVGTPAASANRLTHHGRQGLPVLRPIQRQVRTQNMRSR